ncbi:MAG: EthD family reductase [Bacteroidota bacterium]
MVKLVALYKKPPDPEEFDRHYFTIHTPLVENYPGLRKLEITRISGAPLGDARYHLMAEMYFDSTGALERAMASPEGKAVAKDLLSFAAQFVTVFIGEVGE